MFEEPRLLFQGLTLGEGVVWLERQQALAFVDITQQRVYLMKQEEPAPRGVDIASPVGCVVPMTDGRLLVAARDTLLALDGDTLKTEHIFYLHQPKGLRFNDGKCDAQGRLWIGTMSENQDLPMAKSSGSFFCIEKESVVFSQGGYGIPNGIAFLPDGSFYHTDTATNGIDLCKLSQDKKTFTRKRVISISPQQGAPDGFCIDTQGNLWVALWGGGVVACINPSTGKWLHTLVMPDKNVSCCCFGGQDLSTLYITTAKNDEGFGGHLYAVKTQAKGFLPFLYERN